MSSKLRLVSVMAALVLTCTCVVAAGGLCQVRGDVADNLGNLVDASELTMTVDGVGIPAQQNKAFPAPCGHYVLSVAVRGFQKATQEGDIDQVNQVITVGMRIAAMEVPWPSCAIIGRVSGQSAVSRVRLIQLYGRYVVDAPANVGKTVDFLGLECGDYLLVAMGAKGCLGTEVVRASMAGTRADLVVRDHAVNGCSTLEGNR